MKSYALFGLLAFVFLRAESCNEVVGIDSGESPTRVGLYCIRERPEGACRRFRGEVFYEGSLDRYDEMFNIYDHRDGTDSCWIYRIDPQNPYDPVPPC